MENKELKTYEAFISYSHKDSCKSKSLHRRLEAYRIPKSVRKEVDRELPERIKPVYLDNDESIPGKDLNKIMSDFLDQSKALIVVCSPNSAKSDYVDFEINTFKTKYPDREIIPYIIKGVPKSKDTDKICYPKSLDSKTTGVLLKELSRQKALVKVVSGLYDINFDLLWDRHKRRQRKIRLIWTVATIIIVSLFIGVLKYAQYTKYIKDATLNYKKATELIDEGATSKGIAYLTKSLEHIDYEPSVQKLKNVLLQGSFLILDSITTNKHDNDSPCEQLKLSGNNTCYTPLGTYKLSIENEKLTIKNTKDSKTIESLELHHRGNITPITRFTLDEKVMFVAEPIYKNKDITPDDLKEVLSGSNGFRLRIFTIEPFSVIKDIHIDGALSDITISPMGNHLVAAYRKEKEYETTLEAFPLSNEYKHWECTVLGCPKMMLFNPNGLSFSVIISQSVSEPDKIMTFDIFNADSKGYPIPLTDKIDQYCFSNDGRRMAILTNSKELFIYDIPKCTLAFSPRLLSSSSDVVSMDFDISDEKINVRTPDTTYSYLLQKSPFQLCSVKFTEQVIDKLYCNSSKNIVATVHYVFGDKGYILFDGAKIPPLLYEEKISAVAFSTNGNYLAVGTGNLSNGTSQGDLYLYHLMNNNDSIIMAEVWHSKLTHPVSNIVFNQRESCLAAYTVSGHIDTEVSCLLIDKNNHVTINRILCNSNVQIAQFINNNELAIGTTNSKVELWNVDGLEKKGEIKTKNYPIDIETDKSGHILIASSFFHNSGEINCFDKNGSPIWDFPWTTKFGIMKIIVVDNEVVVVSENNVISIIDLKTKERIAEDLKVQGTIKNSIVINGLLKVLSHNPSNDGLRSYIQTFDLPSGNELGQSLIKDEKTEDIDVFNYDLLYYTPNYFFRNQLATTSLNIDLKALTETANVIAGCQTNHYGVIEATSIILSSMQLNNSLKKWFCASHESRMILPEDTVHLTNQINSLCELGNDEVIQALDVYPSCSKAQNEFWFDEAKQMAEENFINNKNAQSINQLNEANINWEAYFSNYKTTAIYNDDKARLFADFYTKLMVRQHPNDISAINERATFCRHIGKTDEYNQCMEKIENYLLENL